MIHASRLGLNLGGHDGVEIGTELLGGSAQPGAGGGRRRPAGAGGGGAVPGQRVLHLQGAGPARRHR